MSQQKPRQRGGRVLDKATPEQVMGLARNLPLTHSVLEKALADATPGQLGFLANLFEKENASRAESKRRRLLKQAGFPQSKTLEGYDRGMASFPADRGREQLESLEFVDRAEDLVFYGDVGCGKTHLAIAIGMLACQRMIPVRFFTASSLVMRLRKAKDDNRLDAELKSIGRAGLVIIDELGYLPIDIDGARLLFQVIADSYECISSSRCFVFSHVFFSGLGSCMHFPYFSGCAEVFLPNMRASLTRRLWPVNSRSRPWCTMRSMIAAASLSSAKTVPHLLNSMFVVNMMLRLS